MRRALMVIDQVGRGADERNGTESDCESFLLL
jgi:hypothetical protein